jgi:hypothetical protein
MNLKKMLSILLLCQVSAGAPITSTFVAKLGSVEEVTTQNGLSFAMFDVSKIPAGPFPTWGSVAVLLQPSKRLFLDGLQYETMKGSLIKNPSGKISIFRAAACYYGEDRDPAMLFQVDGISDLSSMKVSPYLGELQYNMDAPLFMSELNRRYTSDLRVITSVLPFQENVHLDEYPSQDVDACTHAQEVFDVPLHTIKGRNFAKQIEELIKGCIQ